MTREYIPNFLLYASITETVDILARAMMNNKRHNIDSAHDKSLNYSNLAFPGDSSLLYSTNVKDVVWKQSWNGIKKKELLHHSRKNGDSLCKSRWKKTDILTGLLFSRRISPSYNLILTLSNFDNIHFKIINLKQQLYVRNQCRHSLELRTLIKNINIQIVHSMFLTYCDYYLIF